MKPCVSIIISSKNSSGTIRKLLNSIFNDGDRNFFEVIAVDSSNDETEKTLKEFPIRIFKLPYSTKRNVSLSRNFGISKAKGDFIYFIDADSFIHKNWQSHLKKIIKEDVEIFGGQTSTTGNFFDFYCENSIKSPMRFVKTSYKVNNSNFYRGNWPLACNLVIRKDIFKKIGNFDFKMENYEEVDFLWRAFTQGIDIWMFPLPKITHSYNKSIIEGMKTYFRYGSGFGKFALKYPLSPLSISRLFLTFLFVGLFISFVYSVFNVQKYLIYFLLPLLGLYIYYAIRDKFVLKNLLLPPFDILYAGISYNLGILYSLFKGIFMS